eukprot:UN13686
MIKLVVKGMSVLFDICFEFIYFTMWTNFECIC